MKKLTELDVYILKQEFPQLSLTEDPDIERYFEFRALNRQSEALKLYNTKLKHKYPDDKVRVLLMTYYRKRDYRFHVLLTDSLAQLAAKTILQVKRTILFFTETVAPLKTAKVYTIIQVCEKIIAAISPDRFAAIGFTEKYVRYAVKLQFHDKMMKQAADIIRMYITDTISSVREFRAEHNRKIIEDKNRKIVRREDSVVDFSKITFTKQQIDAITIPAVITRTEDKVLAYTMKYWDRYADGAFENILLLYSRKYGTHHYNVFQAVKVGRIRGWKDEEILHAVLANVARGYYYSITGDLYLQRAWKQIRAKIALVPQQKALPSPSAKNEKASHRIKPQQKTKKVSVQPSRLKIAGKAEIINSAAAKKTAVAQKLPANGTAVSAQRMQNGEAHMAAETMNAPLIATTEHNHQKTIPPVPAVEHYPVQTPQAQGFSIADMVKKLSGKSYGIYRDIFFKTVRPSIRIVLQHASVHKLSFFGSAQNNAEDIIYDFLETHYDNPYQQWQRSNEQAAVLQEGFRIDNLEAIISHWVKHNL